MKTTITAFFSMLAISILILTPWQESPLCAFEKNISAQIKEGETGTGRGLFIRKADPGNRQNSSTGAPGVIDLLPEEGSAAPVSVTLVITFTGPMDRESVEKGFSLFPGKDEPLPGENQATPGAFFWAGRMVAFRPDAALVPGVTYTIHIEKTAKNENGIPMESDYTSRFTTFASQKITCPVIADTTVFMGTARDGKGFPEAGPFGGALLYASAHPGVDARVFMKFDLEELSGYTGDKIVSARVFYTMMYPADEELPYGIPSPAATSMYGFIRALSFDSADNPEGGDASFVIWDETPSGYTDRDHRPGYAPEGTRITALHNTGPFTRWSWDITPIVKGWASGWIPKNGIELADHDDQADRRLGEGMGYCWVLASKEDAANAPYLEVVVRTDPKVGFDGAQDPATCIRPGEALPLHAFPGLGESISWEVFTPMGEPAGNHYFEKTHGSPFSGIFTADETCGRFRIRVSDAYEEAEISFGVCHPDVNIVQDRRFPLFPGKNAPEDALVNMMSNLRRDMGETGGIRDILLDTRENPLDTARSGFTGIGGTGRENLARAVISHVGAQDSGELNLPLFDKDGTPDICTRMTIPEQRENSAFYAVFMDTSLQTLDESSKIYRVVFFDENGLPLPAPPVAEMILEMEFNRYYIMEDQLREKEYQIRYAPATGDFFGPLKPDNPMAVPVENIVSVDYDRGILRFLAPYPGSYGIMILEEEDDTGNTGEKPADGGDADSGGGSCFMTNTFSRTHAYGNVFFPAGIMAWIFISRKAFSCLQKKPAPCP